MYLHITKYSNNQCRPALKIETLLNVLCAERVIHLLCNGMFFVMHFYVSPMTVNKATEMECVEAAYSKKGTQRLFLLANFTLRYLSVDRMSTFPTLAPFKGTLM